MPCDNDPLLLWQDEGDASLSSVNLPLRNGLHVSYDEDRTKRGRSR